MATVRDGSVPVLMVVDLQVGVVRDAWAAARVVGQAARLVDAARASAVPVIWVQHEDDVELPRGSEAWAWAPPLRPAAGECVIAKRFNSAFEDTALERELARLGASHVVLAGAATNWCIRASAYAALERGYDLTLVGDAHTTGAWSPDDTPAPEPAAIVRDLNIVIGGVRYPGRRNRVVDTAEVDFRRLAAER